MLRKLALAIFVALAMLMAFTGFAFAEEVVEQAGKSDGYYIGIGLAIGLGAIGTGIAQARIGAAAIGAIAEDRSLFGTSLLILVIPETLVIFGFVVAMILLGR